MTAVATCSGDLLNLDNARVKAQREVMERFAREGKCPFCPENIDRAAVRPVIKRGNYWHVRENYWPYKNTRVHLLIILNRHVETLAGLTAGEALELLELSRWAERERQIQGGGLCLRFGDTQFNAGTVKHLHAHIITPEVTDKRDPAYLPVRFYLLPDRDNRG